MRTFRFEHAVRRIVCMVVSIGVMATLVQAAQAAEPIDTLATGYQPSIAESIDASGFKHPGVGFTKAMLENMRTQVLGKKEPWNSHFNDLTKAAQASRTPGISNVLASDPTKPRIYGIDSQGANGQFIADSLTAYTQAILYYVTGDEVYRANAMRIIRLYEQMDPGKFLYFVDSHIHTGIPLSRMVGAAEILRYTSTQDPALAWTEDDTLKFSANLVVPVVQTFNNCNCRFMNQHLFTTIGKMTGSIFTGDRAGYDQAVEWFTVNKDAPDPAWTGSILQMFRMVTRNDATGETIEPQVQHVEMGRDQAHGADDLTNAQILSRLMMAQGTKVDPVTGTPSTASNALGPYEFLGDRQLAVNELYGSFMVGHDIPWVPVAMSLFPDGTIRAMYTNVSGAYRGRLTQNIWEAYYYYKYARSINMAQQAPNFTKAYAKRQGYNWAGADGGGDFWLAIPKEAEAEGSTYLPVPIISPYKEVEDRFTAYDGNITAQTEGTTAFINVTATPAGTRLAVFSYADSATSIGLRFRSNGQATLDVSGKSFALPDTQGQWRYMALPISLGDFLPMSISGAGTTVAIDHLNIRASTLLTPPVFKLGNVDQLEYSYVGTTLALTFDLSATDPGAGEVLTYKMDNLPAGATFNTSTGAFSWTPGQAGTYVLVAEASDGTTVTTKRITIVVAPDRQAAVAAVNAPYEPDTLYVTSTKTAYQAVYADMQNTIGFATDAEYFQKLASLRTAVSGLQQLTPLLKDGSMDYTKLFFNSSMATNFGSNPANGVDSNTDSFFAFTIARESNRAFTLDFGPGFKVAASAFQLQPHTSFPERVGGVTIFGSNDNETWTRLMPEETLGIEEMQTLNVQENLRNQRYRFFKVHMIHELWSYNILELGEFRIFGTRYETVNKLSKVSLASDQAAVRSRVVVGNTIKLSFQSIEALNNVSATIQGEPATIATTDNLNWTATLVIKSSTAPGPVKFLLNYQTADGQAAEPTLFTTDSTTLFIANQTNYIANLLGITTVTDSSNRNAADTVSVAARLFDDNLSTAPDYRVNGSGNGAWVSFDFRSGGTVKLSHVDIIGLQNTNFGRIDGAVVQASNDYTNWTTISTAAVATMEWQLLKINDASPYRYVRIYNPNAWFGNMTELRLYGQAASTQKIASLSINSPQALRTRIIMGDTATLNFKANEPIGNVAATIQGKAATVSTNDNINFTASATLGQGSSTGPVQFAINYTAQNGQAGQPSTQTSDGSGLILVDESDVIKNLGTVATLIDSTANRTAATTLNNVNLLSDKNLGSGSDFRNGASSCSGAYIVFDFKSGNQANLSNVELIGPQDAASSRMNGVVVQGSNDGAAWTTLTSAGINTQEWQNLIVASLVPYRYIRIYNGNSWCGSLRELRLHGRLGGADVSAPVTTATAPQGPVNGDATVSFTATDNQGGSGVKATYYTVDGGAQQTGTSVALSTNGTHTVSYWSADWAGNIEAARTLTVTVDKWTNVTGAVTISRSGLTMNRFNQKYTGSVTITNGGGQTVAGPLQLHLQGLSAGVTLDNKTGDKAGVPYITLPAADLAPGQSVTLTTTFSNPSTVSIGYTPMLISIQ
jgi:hypothetical protein